MYVYVCLHTPPRPLHLLALASQTTRPAQWPSFVAWAAISDVVCWGMPKAATVDYTYFIMTGRLGFLMDAAAAPATGTITAAGDTATTSA